MPRNVSCFLFTVFILLLASQLILTVSGQTTYSQCGSSGTSFDCNLAQGEVLTAVGHMTAFVPTFPQSYGNPSTCNGLTATCLEGAYNGNANPWARLDPVTNKPSKTVCSAATGIQLECPEQFIATGVCFDLAGFSCSLDCPETHTSVALRCKELDAMWTTESCIWVVGGSCPGSHNGIAGVRGVGEFLSVKCCATSPPSGTTSPAESSVSTVTSGWTSIVTLAADKFGIGACIGCDSHVATVFYTGSLLHSTNGEVTVTGSYPKCPPGTFAISFFVRQFETALTCVHPDVGVAEISESECVEMPGNNPMYCPVDYTIVGARLLPESGLGNIRCCKMYHNFPTEAQLLDVKEFIFASYSISTQLTALSMTYGNIPRYLWSNYNNIVGGTEMSTARFLLYDPDSDKVYFPTSQYVATNFYTSLHMIENSCRGAVKRIVFDQLGSHGGMSLGPSGSIFLLRGNDAAQNAIYKYTSQTTAPLLYFTFGTPLASGTTGITTTGQIYSTKFIEYDSTANLLLGVSRTSAFIFSIDLSTNFTQHFIGNPTAGSIADSCTGFSSDPISCHRSSSVLASPEAIYIHKFSNQYIICDSYSVSALNLTSGNLHRLIGDGTSLGPIDQSSYSVPKLSALKGPGLPIAVDQGENVIYIAYPAVAKIYKYLMNFDVLMQFAGNGGSAGSPSVHTQIKSNNLEIKSMIVTSQNLVFVEATTATTIFFAKLRYSPTLGPFSNVCEDEKGASWICKAGSGVTSCGASEGAVAVCLDSNGNHNCRQCSGPEGKGADTSLHCTNMGASTAHYVSGSRGDFLACPTGTILASVCTSDDNPSCIIPASTTQYEVVLTCKETPVVPRTTNPYWIALSKRGRSCGNFAGLVGLCVPPCVGSDYGYGYCHSYTGPDCAPPLHWVDGASSQECELTTAMVGFSAKDVLLEFINGRRIAMQLCGGRFDYEPGSISYPIPMTAACAGPNEVIIGLRRGSEMNSAIDRKFVDVYGVACAKLTYQKATECRWLSGNEEIYCPSGWAAKAICVSDPNTNPPVNCYGKEAAVQCCRFSEAQTASISVIRPESDRVSGGLCGTDASATLVGNNSLMKPLDGLNKNGYAFTNLGNLYKEVLTPKMRIKYCGDHDVLFFTATAQHFIGAVQADVIDGMRYVSTAFGFPDVRGNIFIPFATILDSPSAIEYDSSSKKLYFSHRNSNKAGDNYEVHSLLLESPFRNRAVTHATVIGSGTFLPEVITMQYDTVATYGYFSCADYKIYKFDGTVTSHIAGDGGDYYAFNSNPLSASLGQVFGLELVVEGSNHWLYLTTETAVLRMDVAQATLTLELLIDGLNDPRAVRARDGALYIAEVHCIKKLTSSSGTWTSATFAGDCSDGTLDPKKSDFTDRENVRFEALSDLDFSSTRLYYVDANQRIGAIQFEEGFERKTLKWDDSLDWQCSAKIAPSAVALGENPHMTSERFGVLPMSGLCMHYPPDSSLTCNQCGPQYIQTHAARFALRDKFYHAIPDRLVFANPLDTAHACGIENQVVSCPSGYFAYGACLPFTHYKTESTLQADSEDGQAPSVEANYHCFSQVASSNPACNPSTTKVALMCAKAGLSGESMTCEWFPAGSPGGGACPEQFYLLGACYGSACPLGQPSIVCCRLYVSACEAAPKWTAPETQVSCLTGGITGMCRGTCDPTGYWGIGMQYVQGTPYTQGYPMVVRCSGDLLFESSASEVRNPTSSSAFQYCEDDEILTDLFFLATGGSTYKYSCRKLHRSRVLHDDCMTLNQYTEGLPLTCPPNYYARGICAAGRQPYSVVCDGGAKYRLLCCRVTFDNDAHPCQAGGGYSVVEPIQITHIAEISNFVVPLDSFNQSAAFLLSKRGGKYLKMNDYGNDDIEVISVSGFAYADPEPSSIPSGQTSTPTLTLEEPLDFLDVGLRPSSAVGKLMYFQPWNSLLYYHSHAFYRIENEVTLIHIFGDPYASTPMFPTTTSAVGFFDVEDMVALTSGPYANLTLISVKNGIVSLDVGFKEASPTKNLMNFSVNAFIGDPADNAGVPSPVVGVSRLSVRAQPTKMAVDAASNLYYIDALTQTIHRKLAGNEQVDRLIGGAAQSQLRCTHSCIPSNVYLSNPTALVYVNLSGGRLYFTTGWSCVLVYWIQSNYVSLGFGTECVYAPAAKIVTHEFSSRMPLSHPDFLVATSDTLYILDMGLKRIFAHTLVSNEKKFSQSTNWFCDIESIMDANAIADSVCFSEQNKQQCRQCGERTSEAVHLINFGSVAMNYVKTGYFVYGQNFECPFYHAIVGKKSASEMYCARPIGHLIRTDSCYWKQVRGFGVATTCENGEVLTGFCMGECENFTYGKIKCCKMDSPLTSAFCVAPHTITAGSECGSGLAVTGASAGGLEQFCNLAVSRSSSVIVSSGSLRRCPGDSVVVGSSYTDPQLTLKCASLTEGRIDYSTCIRETSSNLKKRCHAGYVVVMSCVAPAGFECLPGARVVIECCKYVTPTAKNMCPLGKSTQIFSGVIATGIDHATAGMPSSPMYPASDGHRDAAFNPSDGLLYAIDASQYALVRFDILGQREISYIVRDFSPFWKDARSIAFLSGKVLFRNATNIMYIPTPLSFPLSNGDATVLAGTGKQGIFIDNTPAISQSFAITAIATNNQNCIAGITTSSVFSIDHTLKIRLIAGYKPETQTVKLSFPLSTTINGLAISDAPNHLILFSFGDKVRLTNMESNTFTEHTLTGKIFHSAVRSTTGFILSVPASHCLKKLDYSGTFSDYAGMCGSSGTTFTSTTKTLAQFNTPQGLAVGILGYLIADTGNRCILISLFSSDSVEPLIGNCGGTVSSTDGPDLSATIASLGAIATSKGNSTLGVFFIDGTKIRYSSGGNTQTLTTLASAPLGLFGFPKEEETIGEVLYTSGTTIHYLTSSGITFPVATSDKNLNQLIVTPCKQLFVSTPGPSSEILVTRIFRGWAGPTYPDWTERIAGGPDFYWTSKFKKFAVDDPTAVTMDYDTVYFAQSNCIYSVPFVQVGGSVYRQTCLGGVVQVKSMVASFSAKKMLFLIGDDDKLYKTEARWGSPSEISFTRPSGGMVLASVAASGTALFVTYRNIYDVTEYSYDIVDDVNSLSPAVDSVTAPDGVEVPGTSTFVSCASQEAFRSVGYNHGTGLPFGYSSIGGYKTPIIVARECVPLPPGITRNPSPIVNCSSFKMTCAPNQIMTNFSDEYVTGCGLRPTLYCEPISGGSFDPQFCGWVQADSGLGRCNNDSFVQGVEYDSTNKVITSIYCCNDPKVVCSGNYWIEGTVDSPLSPACPANTVVIGYVADVFGELSSKLSLYSYCHGHYTVDVSSAAQVRSTTGIEAVCPANQVVIALGFDVKSQSTVVTCATIEGTVLYHTAQFFVQGAYSHFASLLCPENTVVTAVKADLTTKIYTIQCTQVERKSQYIPCALLDVGPLSTGFPSYSASFIEAAWTDVKLQYSAVTSGISSLNYVSGSQYLVFHFPDEQKSFIFRCTEFSCGSRIAPTGFATSNNIYPPVISNYLGGALMYFNVGDGYRLFVDGNTNAVAFKGPAGAVNSSMNATSLPRNIHVTGIWHIPIYSVYSSRIFFIREDSGFSYLDMIRLDTSDYEQRVGYGTPGITTGDGSSVGPTQLRAIASVNSSELVLADDSYPGLRVLIVPTNEVVLRAGTGIAGDPLDSCLTSTTGCVDTDIDLPPVSAIAVGNNESPIASLYFVGTNNKVYKYNYAGRTITWIAGLGGVGSDTRGDPLALRLPRINALCVTVVNFFFLTNEGILRLRIGGLPPASQPAVAPSSSWLCSIYDSSVSPALLYSSGLNAFDFARICAGTWTPTLSFVSAISGQTLSFPSLPKERVFAAKGNEIRCPNGTYVFALGFNETHYDLECRILPETFFGPTSPNPAKRPIGEDGKAVCKENEIAIGLCVSENDQVQCDGLFAFISCVVVVPSSAVGGDDLRWNSMSCPSRTAVTEVCVGSKWDCTLHGRITYFCDHEMGAGAMCKGDFFMVSTQTEVVSGSSCSPGSIIVGWSYSASGTGPYSTTLTCRMLSAGVLENCFNIEAASSPWLSCPSGYAAVSVCIDPRGSNCYNSAPGGLRCCRVNTDNYPTVKIGVGFSSLVGATAWSDNRYASANYFIGADAVVGYKIKLPVIVGESSLPADVLQIPNPSSIARIPQTGVLLITSLNSSKIFAMKEVSNYIFSFDVRRSCKSSQLRGFRHIEVISDLSTVKIIAVDLAYGKAFITGSFNDWKFNFDAQMANGGGSCTVVVNAPNEVISHLTYTPNEDRIYLADAGRGVILRSAVGSYSSYEIFAGVLNENVPKNDWGHRTAARFSLPTSVAVTLPEEVLVADAKDCVVRKIQSNGTVVVFMGDYICQSVTSYNVGNGLFASIPPPRGLSFDKTFNIYIALGNGVEGVIVRINVFFGDLAMLSVNSNYNPLTFTKYTTRPIPPFASMSIHFDASWPGSNLFLVSPHYGAVLHGQVMTTPVTQLRFVIKSSSNMPSLYAADGVPIFEIHEPQSGEQAIPYFQLRLQLLDGTALRGDEELEPMRAWIQVDNTSIKSYSRICSATLCDVNHPYYYFGYVHYVSHNQSDHLERFVLHPATIFISYPMFSQRVFLKFVPYSRFTFDLQIPLRHDSLLFSEALNVTCTVVNEITQKRVLASEQSFSGTVSFRIMDPSTAVWQTIGSSTLVDNRAVIRITSVPFFVLSMTPDSFTMTNISVVPNWPLTSINGVSQAISAGFRCSDVTTITPTNYLLFDNIQHSFTLQGRGVQSIFKRDFEDNYIPSEWMELLGISPHLSFPELSWGNESVFLHFNTVVDNACRIHALYTLSSANASIPSGKATLTLGEWRSLSESTWAEADNILRKRLEVTKVTVATRTVLPYCPLSPNIARIGESQLEVTDSGGYRTSVDSVAVTMGSAATILPGQNLTFGFSAVQWPLLLPPLAVTNVGGNTNLTVELSDVVGDGITLAGPVATETKTIALESTEECCSPSVTAIGVYNCSSCGVNMFCGCGPDFKVSLVGGVVFPFVPPFNTSVSSVPQIRTPILARIGPARCEAALLTPTSIGIEKCNRSEIPKSANPSIPDLAIEVLLENGHILVQGLPFRFNFALEEGEQPLVIHNITGCLLDAFPGTGMCLPEFGLPITISGAGFADVVSLEFIGNGQATCGNTQILNNGSTILCSDYMGYGTNLQLNMTLRSGSEVFRRPTISFVPTKVDQCPISSIFNKRCGSGKCNPRTGICNCSTFPTMVGPACDTCTLTTWGLQCQNTCPANTEGTVCSNHGHCDGLFGNGTCICDRGYAGTACQIICEGGAVAPCGNHGICSSVTGFCSCYNNTQQGFWTGTGCPNCQEGWSGVNCTAVCPRAADLSICNRIGTCSDGVCICPEGFCGPACELTGETCRVCPVPGRFGLQCEKICPGVSMPCSGHGSCDEGRYGTGRCTCASGYAGNDCSMLCPGGITNQCNKQGVCRPSDGVCLCNTSWAGTSCQTACPGYPNNLCSGHGLCQEGSTRDGTCICDYGYTKANCSAICPGGLNNICNMHGTCDRDGCHCFDNDEQGHWGGVDCSICASEWFGLQCTQQCEKIDGIQCNGHGSCTVDVTCKCKESSVDGFWTGTACETCQPGYYGPECLDECPGGWCYQCTGHGTCFDGVSGNGTCTCTFSSDNGYWSSADCSLCAPCYFGEKCANRCPWSTKFNNACGKGTCSEGVDGDGSCTCFTNWAKVDGAEVCENCQPGFYSADCSRQCPGKGTCSGHGVCSDGTNGTGVCTCFLGYITEDCGILCPVSNNTICGGNGNCSTLGGVGVCTCATGFAKDASGSCSICSASRFGLRCQLCPNCGQGICDEGITGTGQCVCSGATWGELCDQPCLRDDKGVVCSGHGLCRKSDGACVCFSDATKGYYNGQICDTCDPLYQSFGCKVPCPISSGKVCGGRGKCQDGSCYDCEPLASDDATIVCGLTCEKFDSDCLVNNCPAGKWGTTCSENCPACLNGGVCREDTGKCACAKAFGGTLCETECSIGSNGYVCSRLGICREHGCDCDKGYFGGVCEFECPGGAATPCNERGTCLLSGVCECTSGYTGADCGLICPGGTENVCSKKGFCQIDGTCKCFNNNTHGYFMGTACDKCQNGYAGENCLAICFNGITQGKECLCSVGYAGMSCDKKCPGVETGVFCSGHGRCNDKNTGDGTCVCDANYFAYDCANFCTVQGCQLDHQMLNPQCSVNGTCQCLDDPLDGHFVGDHCDTCKTFYWGTTCALVCQCNQHGGCERSTGRCTCFRDDSNGYWDGEYCTKCAQGYIGTDCKGINIEISVNPEDSTSVSVKVLDSSESVLFFDSKYKLAYVGCWPLMVMNTSVSPMTIVQQVPEGLDLNGTVKSLRFSETEESVILVTVVLGSGAVEIHHISRGLPVLQLGKELLDLSAFAVASSSRRRLLAAPRVIQSLSSDGITVLIMSSNELGVPQSDGSMLVIPLPDMSAVVGGQISTSVSGSKVLTVYGDKLNRWLVLTTILPLSASSTFTSFSDVTVHIRDCVTTTYCQRAALCSLTSVYPTTESTSLEDRIVCGFQSPEGPIIGSFPPVAQTSIIDGESNHLMNQRGMTFSFTALAFDQDVMIGLVAFNFASQPSYLFKFSLASLAPTGTYLFSYWASEPEIVTTLAVNSIDRELHAVILLSFTTKIVSMNLFGIKTITPNILDSSGNVTVTIAGEGFSTFALPVCMFSSDARSESSAEVLSSSQMRCVAPKSVEQGGDCATISFNVRFGRRKTDTSNAPVTRPQSAFVEGAITALGGPFGNERSDTRITVTGYGFVPSSFAKCKLISAGGASMTLESSYINSTAIVCHQTGNMMATVPPTFVVYSHDSQIFAESTVQYAIVGYAFGLRVAVPSNMPTIRSAHVAVLPEIHVHVVDAYGNSLYNLDSYPVGEGPHPIIASILFGTTQFTDSNTTERTKDGIATFESLKLAAPKVGILTIIFATSSIHRFSWDCAFDVKIITGDAVAIRLLNQNASLTWRWGVTKALPLIPKVEAVIVDPAGNPIQNLEALPRLMTVTFAQEKPSWNSVKIVSFQTAATDDGVYTFPDIQTQGRFGEAFELKFSVNNPELGISDLIVGVSTQNCVTGAEYGVKGTFDCRKCPDHGICDGSTLVKVQSGYWRSDPDSYIFYSCKPPYSGDTCRDGTCIDSYQGPRCSVCDEGYGKNGLTCSKCYSTAVNVALMCLVGLVLFGAIFILVANSIQNPSAAGQTKDILPLVIKIFANYLQVSSKVTATFMHVPSTVQTMTDIQSSASNLDFSFGFINCETKANFYGQFVGLVLIPVLLCAIFAIVMVIRNLFKQRRPAADLIAEAETDAIMRNDLHQKKEIMEDEEDDSFDAYEQFVAAVAEVEPQDAAFTPSIEQLPGELARSQKYQVPDEPARSKHISQFELDYQKEIQRFSEDPKFFSGLQVATVTAVIVMFLFYQTIIETCGKMLQCETLDYGTYTVSVLSADRSIDCSTSQHQAYVALALIVMIFIGLGFPFLSCLLVKLLAKSSFGGDLSQARTLFYFMTGGYSDAQWFWEAVVMSRKAAIAIIVVVVKDIKLRSYLAMWTMAFFFVLNAIYLPFEDSTLSRLETMSLLAVLLTLNLGALFEQFPEDDNPGMFWTVAISILTINILCIGMFLVLFLFAGYKKLRRMYFENPDKFGFMSWMFREPQDVQDEANEKVLKALEQEVEGLKKLVYQARTEREIIMESAIALLDELEGFQPMQPMHGARREVDRDQKGDPRLLNHFCPEVREWEKCRATVAMGANVGVVTNIDLDHLFDAEEAVLKALRVQQLRLMRK